MRISKMFGAAAVAAGALALSACASIPATVTRYQAMPAPAGQSFYIVPASGGQPSLEFGRYASLISQQLAARGYRPAGAPQLADMLVKVSYDVDEGERRVTIDPMARSRYYDPFYRGFYDPFYGGFYGRPYYSRYGYYGRRSPFYYGWDDPFWYGSPYGGYGLRDPIREYTVYESELDIDIVDRRTNQPLFEGLARARSQTDELGTLVPNLVEAMFTNFPGRSGETIKITVPARKRS